MTPHLRLLAVAVSFLAPTIVTFAHEGATGPAKERMDLMGDMSKAMKDIYKHVSGNRDLPAIAELAGRIHADAPKIPDLFPVGSGTGITDAKPEIWKSWDDFQAKVQKLEDESAALTSIAASGDPKAIGAQYTEVIHACTGCHTDYRRGRADKL